MEKEFFSKKLNESELIQCIRTVKAKIKGIKKSFKKLNAKQTALLKRNNNHASDWKTVFVSPGTDLRNIRNSYFSGEVYIGDQKKSLKISDQAEFASGIYDSTIHDCIIDSNVLIKQNAFISNYYIGEDSILFNNSTITASPHPACGNGKEISVGIETGGREVLVFAELKLEDAVNMALKKSDKDIMEGYRTFLKEYQKEMLFEKGVIFRKGRLLNNGVIKDSFIGEAARVENSLKVDNCTLLSTETETVRISDGAYVRDSIIQWGCEATSLAIVDASVLIEHSEVERHGKVISSIIGSNTGVAEGEVNASLLGPFVGFHHQALLIAALWPEGKGNVAYGANVGSNHTGKIADQEIFPGEGIFFGLGCDIKFPADYSLSPYSIISTGAVMLPQRVEFPFSLFNLPSENIPAVSPVYNEILPGWVLSDNLYAVKRNEAKYKKRNKAKRNQFIFDVFRPDIMDLVLAAREKLIQVKDPREVYTDKDIPGLGKNYLLEKYRKEAIDTYSFFLQYYGLKGLKDQLVELSRTGKVRITLEAFQKIRNDRQWDHQRALLLKEFPAPLDLKELLKKYIMCEEKIAVMIKSSKEKDDIRGRKIIPDYDLSHTMAENDSVVKEVLQQLPLLKKEVEGIIGMLE